MNAAAPNPFSSNSFELASLLGPCLLRKDGIEVASNAVVVDVIGLYFSAHWCPPCRQFTPLLGAVYQQCREAKKSLEIVFVSSDKSIQQFNEYFQSMADWLALPFGSYYKEALGAKYSVEGIPMLVLLNGFTGVVITTDGRQRVAQPSFLNSLTVDLDADVRDVESVEALLNLLESAVVCSGNVCQMKSPTIDAEAKLAGLTVLGTAMSNVLKNPNDFKFRVLKKTNKNIELKLRHPVLRQILKYCGWRETKDCFVCYRYCPVRMKDTMELLTSIVESLQENTAT